MTRRADPQRIDEARRAALLARLQGAGISQERAERAVAAWEAEAARQGLERGAAYWEAGWRWIEERRG